MSCNSTDLGFLKQSVSKLREEIKENSRRLDIANLLKMCELGLITNKDVLDSEAYNQYTKSLNLGRKK